jgi:hypothetical protein
VSAKVPIFAVVLVNLPVSAFSKTIPVTTEAPVAPVVVVVPSANEDLGSVML